MADSTPYRPPARITLFGVPATDADVEVLRRGRSWRLTRALVSIGVAWALIPVVALLPPHVPWAAFAFAAGIYLAVRRWTERYTLRSLVGRCPECGARQTLGSPARLRFPHPLTCEACGRELLLEVDVTGASPSADPAPQDQPAGSSSRT